MSSILTQAVFAEDRGEAVDTNDALENTETVNVYNKLSVSEDAANPEAAVVSLGEFPSCQLLFNDTLTRYVCKS